VWAVLFANDELSLDPSVSPEQKLTLAIAFAPKAHMFITDMKHSRFKGGCGFGFVWFHSLPVGASWEAIWFCLA
jgi:hypothetical protein